MSISHLIHYEPDETDEGDRRVRLFFGFFCYEAFKNSFLPVVVYDYVMVRYRRVIPI